MNDQYKLWLEVKNDYLEKVRKSLDGLDNKTRNQIIDDVSSHMDCRYEELSDDEKSLDKFKEITVEMGPPSEYADLMGNPDTAGKKIKYISWMVIAAIAVIIICMILLFFQMRSLMSQNGGDYSQTDQAGEKVYSQENEFAKDDADKNLLRDSRKKSVKK